MGYEHSAMGFPPVTCAAYLIAKSFWYNVGDSEDYLKYIFYPIGDKAWVACIYFINSLNIKNILYFYL
jgi:hypothetical protein